MSERDDGGPAFPWGEHGTHLGGMSIRDYFAAQAMEAIVSTVPHLCAVRAADVACEAYDYADAMLAERNKP
jgi:hypothetical protein